MDSAETWSCPTRSISDNQQCRDGIQEYRVTPIPHCVSVTFGVWQRTLNGHSMGTQWTHQWTLQWTLWKTDIGYRANKWLDNISVFNQAHALHMSGFSSVHCSVHWCVHWVSIECPLCDHCEGMEIDESVPSLQECFHGFWHAQAIAKVSKIDESVPSLQEWFYGFWHAQANLSIK